MLLLLCFYVLNPSLLAQTNLVPNGGFEINPNCKVFLNYKIPEHDAEGAIKEAVTKTYLGFWYLASPNRYFTPPRHEYRADKTWTPENGYVCYIGERIRTGNYSMQFSPANYYVKGDTNNSFYRSFEDAAYSYLGSGLTETLEKDSVYRAVMWVSKYFLGSNSTSGIGMYFSEDSAYTELSESYLQSLKQNKYNPPKQALMNKIDNYITDDWVPTKPTRKWHRIRFYFTAKGIEKFLIIGNFRYDTPAHILDAPNFFTQTHTGFQLVPPVMNPDSYFVSTFILDDISVVKVHKSTRREFPICQPTPTQFSIRPDFDSCVWHDGSRQTHRTFSTPGLYWVKSFGWTEWVVDTFEIKLFYPGIYSRDTVLEFNTPLQAPPGISHVWNTGDSSRSIQIKESGLYWVITRLPNCLRLDTFKVSLKNPKGGSTQINLCYGKSYEMGKRPGFSGAIWHDGQIDSSRVFNKSGIYWVRSEYPPNIFVIDSVILNITMDKNRNIDTGFCFGKTLQLHTDSGYTHRWNTLDTGFSIIVNQPGIYWVEKQKEGCLQYDSFVVEMFPALSHSLTDTGYCEGASLYLDAGESNAYTWENLDSSRYRTINQAGLYWVQKSNIYCPSVDSFNVVEYALPNIHLPADTGACFRDKEILILDAGAFRHYLWEPGQDSLRVKEFYQPIKQRLTVIDNNHCSSSKEIDIVSWCEDYFYLPNAFTPTRDGLNETFQPVMNNGVFYEMQIFNRWGDLLYSTRDINQGWDGTYNGQASPSGVYIVTISYSQKNSLQQKSKSANFTLLR